MTATRELESTLTDRYQTTVPNAVRRALKLGKRDKIRYVVQKDGAVLLTRAAPEIEDDPVLGQFLDFLSRDLANNPHHVRGLDAALMARIQPLIAGVEVDLDASLPTDGE